MKLSLSLISTTTSLLFFVFAALIPLRITSAAADDEDYVTCGSAIKLQQVDSKYYLNSEQKNLNSGSGQQLITFVKDYGTHNTLWWVRPAHHSEATEYIDDTCQLAEPIRCGTTIRLTHVSTLRNLHSHGVESPLSRQQEVSAYGEGDAKGDAGDNWIVQCKTGQFWQRSQEIRLLHVDTQKYLGTSKTLEFNVQTCGQNCPIMGHLEAFARASTDKHGQLVVEQGVHLSNK
jgi:dolichyl-phosphate-mannose--protein O-mannosyl transferase